MIYNGLFALGYFVYIVFGLLAISFVLNKMFEGKQYCEGCWHFVLGLIWIVSPLAILFGMSK